MDETEMTALKKAYAEIILNTAKEAAARVIVSERRAQSFQRDLVATKDEALRILLRIKQMIDFKMNEAETKSLIQHKRIDELEAQLHEAEDIVSNLRAELYETQAELERISRNQHRPLDYPIHQEEVAQPEGTKEQQGSIKSYGTSVVSSLQPQRVSITEWKSSVGTKNGYDCACYEEHCYAGDAGKIDVPSIIVRRTKPDLYRNGCTQRIRACDRNLLNGHLPLSEQSDDLKCEKLVEAENGGERLGIVVSASGEEATHNEEIVNGKEIINNVKAILRLKRKRALREKRNRVQQEVVPVLGKQVSDTPEVSRSLACTSGSVSCSITENNSDCKVNQEPGLERRLTLTTPSKPSATGTSEMELTDALVLITQESESKTDLGLPGSKEEQASLTSPQELADALVLITQESVSVAVTDKDTELADALVLITQESESKTDLGLPGSKEEQVSLTSPQELADALVLITQESVSVAVTDKDTELADALVLITKESGSKTDIGIPGSKEEQASLTSPQELADALVLITQESVSVAVTDKDTELTDTLVLITKESGSKTDIGLPEEEQENLTSPQEKSTALASDSSDAIPIRSPKDRIVKYTFQRKRRREPISNGDFSSSLQEDSSKRRIGKGHDDAPDSLDN